MFELTYNQRAGQGAKLVWLPAGKVGREELEGKHGYS